jgi:hypothetical protein
LQRKKKDETELDPVDLDELEKFTRQVPTCYGHWDKPIKGRRSQTICPLKPVTQPRNAYCGAGKNGAQNKRSPLFLKAKNPPIKKAQQVRRLINYFE